MEMWRPPRVEAVEISILSAAWGLLPNPANGLPIVGKLSAVAGDFDGDGVDELAIGYAKWNPDTVQTGTYIKGVLTLKYGSNFEASVKDASWQQYTPRNADASYTQRVHVELAFSKRTPVTVALPAELASIPAHRDSSRPLSSFPFRVLHATRERFEHLRSRPTDPQWSFHE